MVKAFFFGMLIPGLVFAAPPVNGGKAAGERPSVPLSSRGGATTVRTRGSVVADASTGFQALEAGKAANERSSDPGAAPGKPATQADTQRFLIAAAPHKALSDAGEPRSGEKTGTSLNAGKSPAEAGQPQALSTEALKTVPELVALQKRLASTRTLSARFEQKRHWAALKDTLATEGALSYERGGKLIWKTLKPSESELVMEGQSATLIFPKLKTQQKFDLSAEPGMAKVFDSITAVLKADLDRLLPEYSVKLIERVPLRLELTPKSEQVAQVVQRLQLGFNAQRDLVTVVLQEAGGDSTEILFKDHVVKLGSP